MTDDSNPLQRGTSIARGEFILDEAQARAKMREFQLVDEVVHEGALVCTEERPEERKSGQSPQRARPDDQLLSKDAARQRAEERNARHRTIADNRRRWVQQPQVQDATWPEGELIFRRSSVVGGLTVIAAWERAGRRSWVEWRKGGRLLSTLPIEGTRVGGLRLAISGSFKANREYDGPAATPEMARAEAALVALVGDGVEEVLSGLGVEDRLALLGDIVCGNLQSALMKTFAWESWPSSLADSTLALAAREVGNIEPRARVAKLGLESLMAVELLPDLWGRCWSLEELVDRERVLTGTDDVDPVALGADARVAVEVVLRGDPYTLRLLHVLFGTRVLDLRDFLTEASEEEGDEKERANELPDARPTPASVVRARWRLWTRLSAPDRQLVESVHDQLWAVEGAPEALERSSFSELEVDHDSSIAAGGLRGATTILNGSHPAIKHAVEYAEDPVALAFVSSTLYDLVGVTTARERVEFLEALSAGLDGAMP